MSRAAAGLREVVPEISELATSPLVRARETAEILARAYEIEIGATTDALVARRAVRRSSSTWIA